MAASVAVLILLLGGMLIPADEAECGTPRQPPGPASAASSASASLGDDSVLTVFAPPRGAIYCQPPSFRYAVNASTAFDSEIADDIPDSLAGFSVWGVTVYPAEWGYPSWVEPEGLVIRFYDGTCPPSLEPLVEWPVSWSAVTATLEDWHPPVRIVYSAAVTLPAPITIGPAMSIGVCVITDWTGPPYAGSTTTEPGSTYGCGEIYWDDETHGSPRWTPLSATTGIAADLAYCLSQEGTGIAIETSTSWGRIKGLFR